VIPKIIENTECIIAECNFEFDLKHQKQNILYEQWRKWCRNTTCKWGFDRIYGNTNVLARARVEKELKVIDELKFSGYFLINWDIIQYSNSMGFMHIGRGSGANSIISYCLGITNICPLRLILWTFLNLNRKVHPILILTGVGKSGIPFSNTFLIDTVEIVWLLWHQCGIQIPLDIPSG
jgi:DNA polymerase-3 subunit alpha/error-prone DNA polymerase